MCYYCNVALSIFLNVYVQKSLCFCSGELEVANARNVLLYTTSGKISNDDGIYGLLCVTNFKLSFLTAGNVTVRITKWKFIQICKYIFGFQNESSVHQENSYLGKNDIALSNIECIYQITERKRRLIGQSKKISSKIEALHIVCKVNHCKYTNFLIQSFFLRFTEFSGAKIRIQALGN